MDGDEAGGMGAAVRAGRVAHGPMLVVPAGPGPLRLLRSDDGRDEVDRWVELALRPTTPEHPGRLDAVLLLAGAAFLTLAVTGSAPRIWGLVGASLVVLGAALPIRDGARRVSERREARSIERLRASGHVLDVGDHSIGRLAAAYEELLREATLPGAIVPAGTMETGHAAVVEVASTLRGLPPADERARVHVDGEAEAIRELARRIVQAPPGVPSRRPLRRRRSKGLPASAERRLSTLPREGSGRAGS
jgi:hypothetical protein